MALSSKEYVKHKGNQCPVCKGDNLNGQEVDVDGGTATQYIVCDDCDSTWVDIYTLTGYTNLEVDEGEAS